MLYNEHDIYIGRSLDLYGEFSEGECDVFRQLIQPGWTVLELGANIGSHTVFLAKRVGPSGRVIAFEPQRIVFQTLCANIALNNLLNVFQSVPKLFLMFDRVLDIQLTCLTHVYKHNKNNCGVIFV